MKFGTEGVVVCSIRLGCGLIVRGGVRAVYRTVWYAGARGDGCIGVNNNASTECNTLKAEKSLSLYTERSYMRSVNPTAIVDRQ